MPTSFASRLFAVATLFALMAAAVAVLVLFADPTPPAESAVAPPQGPDAHFVDRFNTIDAGRWSVSDGWSNGNWVENDWRREHLAATDKGLVFTLGRNRSGGEKPFSSGEIVTQERFLYGYFETRLRAAKGEGLVSGFFTFTRPEGRRSWYEIDMEITGRDTRTLELAYHVGGRPRKQLIRLPFDAAEDFHTYSFDWQPDVIRWYVDNKLMFEARGDRVEAMREPQQLMLNLWNSRALHRWVGDINPRQAPWTMEVACVAQAPVYEGVALCGAASITAR